MELKPVNCNVLIRPDDAADKIGSIMLPDSIRERDQHAATEGVIVSMCDDAFHEMEARSLPGTRVCFTRYSGATVGPPPHP